ncbi:MAG: hypothetical protein QM775_14100 [Pirellulales bacterium]
MSTFLRRLICGLVTILVCRSSFPSVRAAEPIAAGDFEHVEISPDRRGFVLAKSKRPFKPWGFNYDRDARGRLLEDYWDAEWSTVEADFAEMRALGANVVRVHLQFGKFMRSEMEANPAALEKLAALLRLAERERLLSRYHRARLLSQT